ncbi:glycoside hydrolase family 15 protein [Vreelandella lionensis]|uniref:glycoside hydrolase family 15 protein n=1 Tax=Vreelandella lionensis TaxID=1144478 RepID=UPI0009F6B63C|nr:glycoside hydrolase family 15 protein [Halomonas lionensis]
MTQGIKLSGGYLTQAFGHDYLDAALLLIPLMGIPIDKAVLELTAAAVEEHLCHGDVVHRYLASDGLSGSEDAFLICSFWLVDILLMLGRAEEARALFERLLANANANDAGLYAEESDPTTGLFLGNFPQAFTHLALINRALHIQLYE